MKALKHQDIVVVSDTREQNPLPLHNYGFQVVRDKLDFGDYSLLVPDLRSNVAIERKSLPDLVACVTRERERFERELVALRGFRWKCILVEASGTDIANHNYRSKTEPTSVLGSLSRWQAKYGISIYLADNPKVASYFAAQFLYFTANDAVAYSNKKLANANNRNNRIPLQATPPKNNNPVMPKWPSSREIREEGI